MNNINQPVKQKERLEEIKPLQQKTEIVKEFFKTQNMNLEERQPPMKLETNNKNKLNIRIGNIAPDKIIKDIKPKQH